MLKTLAGASPVFLAATIALGAVERQAPAPSQNDTASQVTAVGCLVRNGSVDVDKGVRVLDIAPGALALTRARITSTAGTRTGGAPGSIAQDSDTGTIPRQTIVGGRPGDPDAMAFALIGDRVKSLDDLVGARVEIVGRIPSARSTVDEQPRATTGDSRGGGPVSGGGTRQERPREGAAHPSAELQKLEVISFRKATGGCS